ncbi:MAG TPA: GH3 auxin-responsive promoter family protein, partial [Candidatus Methylomirabilis sp.]|nr:GH3 auxin-responsive promoter family protein [Candidatus Methylomirabilis sp.]
WCWPNLRVFIHGGVAYPPYGRVVEEWVGRPLQRIEVYPASEGFVALQTEAWGLTLMVDYGIFFEFVPVEDLDSPCPRRHTVVDVELHRPYAIALTTPAGLWSYLLGDTIRFTARDPLRLQIIGRTRHFVNAFGENVIVEEVEQALLAACRATEADVAEFTVGPRYPSQGVTRGAHQWLIEFRHPPRDPKHFAQELDTTLQSLNTDYRTKRTGNVGMVAPVITSLPAGTFYRWLGDHGKLGDQHKVPRVTNNRDMIEGILNLIAAGEQPAVCPAGSAGRIS